MNLKGWELCGESGNKTGGEVEDYQKSTKKTVVLSVDFPVIPAKFDGMQWMVTDIFAGCPAKIPAVIYRVECI